MSAEDNSIILKYYEEAFLFLGINLVILFLLFTIYFVIIASIWKPQTVGRMLMKIKVVSLTKKPNIFTLFLRDVVGFIFIGFFGNVCFWLPVIINISMIFGVRKTTIHDLLAKTDVISLKVIEEDKYDVLFD